MPRVGEIKASFRFFDQSYTKKERAREKAEHHEHEHEHELEHTSHEVAALHPVTMAEEDERLGRGGRRQPAAREELHAPRVHHELLMVSHVHLLESADPRDAFSNQSLRRINNNFAGSNIMSPEATNYC